MSASRLDAVRVVLYEPLDPVNIAATVRAMKNMGVSRLRLVRPVAYDPYRVIGVAHDTQDIIDAIEHFDDLESAIGDCVRIAGFTARRRAAKRTVVDPPSADRKSTRLNSSHGYISYAVFCLKKKKKKK